ncbi:MAG: Proline iminopeptidase [Pseudomonadota bacterium]|jgi:proline iminopeptidase
MVLASTIHATNSFQMSHSAFTLNSTPPSQTQDRTTATWIVLHGGPGSGSNPALLKPIQDAGLRGLAPDQLGCGRRHQARSRTITIPALLRDLAQLRVRLGLDRISLCAGSWGAYLALAHAQRYPEHTGPLILRSPFLGGSRDVWNLLSQASKAALTSRTIWPASINELLPCLMRFRKLLQFGTFDRQQSIIHAWLLAESELAVRGARHAWLDSMGNGHEASSQHQLLGRLRRQLRLAKAVQKTRQRSSHAQTLKVRLQLRLLPQAVRQPALRWQDKIEALVLVHGRHDRICPLRNSYRIASQRAAHLVVTNAGHLGEEPSNHRALVDALRMASP